MLLSLLLLLTLSYAAKAAKEKCLFHYSSSVFAKGNPLFFDNRVSWKNKWKGGDPKQGERFLGSSTVFVFVTDFFHLAQFIELNSVMLALSLTLSVTVGYHFLLVFVGIRVIYALVFNLGFDYILKA